MTVQYPTTARENERTQMKDSVLLGREARAQLAARFFVDA